MARRRYAHEDIAAALAALKAAGDNASEAARETGIPEANIRRWAKNPEPEVVNMAAEKEADLSAELRVVAHLLARAIPGKIAEAPLNHTAVALGIIFDKLQLLEGKPTSIDEVRDALSDDERATRVAALLDRARARRAGLAN